MENSIQHLEWRYAVKKFDSQRMLSNNQIEKIKQAFNLTATSYGLQPIKLVIVKNKKLQQELVPSVDANYIADYFKRVVEVRGTPEEILNPFKENLTSNFSDKSIAEIQEWSKNQAYLAMGNLLAICAMEKIDSCPMEGFEPREYDRILELSEKGLTSVLAMPIGYRAEDDAFSGFKKVRKDLNDSVIEIS